MANAAGMIRESIWRDTDYQHLSIRAQRMYMQLLSQKELDCAGVLPLQPEKWATACTELTVDMVWEDLDELQAARFAFYDRASFELLVRTHIRNSNVLKVPNMRKSALRSASLLASPALKIVLADELWATGLPEFIHKAVEINPQLSTQLLAQAGKNLTAEPLSKGYGTLAEPTGNRRQGQEQNLSSNSRGEGPPRPACRKHPNGNPDDENCRGCMKVRQWDEQHAADNIADELMSKRLARERAESCAVCRGTNWIPDTDPAIKCNHQPTEGATTA